MGGKGKKSGTHWVRVRKVKALSYTLRKNQICKKLKQGRLGVQSVKICLQLMS